MTSKASDVETYLRDVPEERRASLTTLRNLCSRVLTGYEEGIDYGMPVYKRNGVTGSGVCEPKAVHRPLRDEERRTG